MMKLVLPTWNSDMFKGWGSIFRMTLCVISAMLISQSVSWSQPKSAGASFAFTGIAFSYEQFTRQDGSFIEASLKTELSDVFLDKKNYPGISGSVSWNRPLREWDSINGNKMTFFTGPGVLVGYGPDHGTTDGLFFGLKARIGVECSFEKKVILSVSLSPVIGSHIVFLNYRVVMRYYRNGLIYSLIPEIGIKYRF